MRRAGQELALDVEHGAVDDEQEKGPSTNAVFKKIAAEVTAADESQEDVDEVEVAHGFEGAECDEGLRSQQNHGDGLLKDAVDEDGGGEVSEHQLTALAGNAGDEPEEG